MQQVQIVTSDFEYPVLVGAGLLSNLEAYFPHPMDEQSKVLVVTDENTKALFEMEVVESLQSMGYNVRTCTFRAGEENKNWETLHIILDAAFDFGMGRKDSMVALGGGVVGDVTGFAASIYMRGINYYQFPTTLLSQIDSSVGGKTAIDTAHGKNVIGTFKQPRMVIADVDCFETLSDEQIASGMAEMLKYALLEGEGFLERLEAVQGRSIPEELVLLSIESKAKIVAEDEKESGIRAILNLGHSFGHALERATNYDRYTHGAAVGIGILAALRIGEILEVTDKKVLPTVLSLLQRLGLDTYTDVSVQECLEHISKDKKHHGTGIQFVLLEEIGKPLLRRIEDEELQELASELEGFCFGVSSLPEKIEILPSALRGLVFPPPSKSIAHRIVLATALAQKDEDGDFTSRIENYRESLSQDITATTICIKRLLEAYREKNKDVVELNCHESGSTLRFLIPIAAALGVPVRLVGEARLPFRPLDDYIEPLTNHGVTLVFSESAGEDGEKAYLPLKVLGSLEAGNYVLRGDSSSQYITGMLYAMCLLEEESTLSLSTHLESAAYVDLTIDVLESFGMKFHVEEKNGLLSYRCLRAESSFAVPEGPLQIERDYSQSAFWYLAKFLGHEIEVGDMRVDSKQGDKAIIACLDELSRRREADTDEVITIDVSQFPDLFPALGVACAKAGPGKRTRLVNAGRLKIKESDRLAATADMLGRMGVEHVLEDEALEIVGTTTLHGADFDSYKDHRLAMAACIAGVSTDARCTLIQAEAIRKSYPSFYREFKRVGANFREM